MSRYIAIECDGVAQVHAEGLGNYATLCGLDGDDQVVGQKTVGLQIGARINCSDCIDLIRYAKTFRPRDFQTKRPTQKPPDAQ